MQLTLEQMDRLADMSMLSFTAEEKAEMLLELEQMLGFIDKVKELDTTGVAPVLRMSGDMPFAREDEVKGELSHEESFKNAPSHDGTYFKVPKVIKK
ncbi:MAG: Asp-tRNA(Asn)/Glu-tRNA(Gln) amidotransferase subunit GatC [Chitinophagaceae bacterium]|nr:Asp-tRNA(Asn)/Glu-tRNA(Gln) amidotransferase subunit GatC [Chitinophagaceae bacterium]